MREATRRQLLGAAVVGAVLLAAAVASSPAAILAAVERLAARPALFVAALVAMYLLRPVFVWPISAVSLLVGYVYGPVVGFPVALAGAALTSLPPFLFARRVRSDEGLIARLGRTGERLFARTGQLRGVFAARLAPFPADAVSCGAGFAGVPATTFVAGTLAGETPWVAAAVLAGSSMRTLTLQGFDSGVPLVVGAAAAAVLVLAGPLYRHVRERAAI